MENRYPVLPNAFTFLNLFFGFFSILKTIQGNFHLAVWWILIAGLMDAMDGRIARWVNASSPFGFHLDALADLVSFGIAPGVLAYHTSLERISGLGILICFFYVFAGAYRLARFQVLHLHSRAVQYEGLTITISGIALSSFWFFESVWFRSSLRGVWAILCCALSLLMISTIPYRWPRLTFREGLPRQLQSLAILLGIVSVLIFPERLLFPFFLLYILMGIVHWAIPIIPKRLSILQFLKLQKN